MASWRTHTAGAVLGLIAGVLHPITDAAADARPSTDASATTARFVPVDPCRVSDSRDQSNATPVGERRWRIAVAGHCGVPHDATAVAVTVAAIAGSDAGWLVAFAAGAKPPSVSMLNYAGGETRSNGAIVQISALGNIEVRTSSSADFVLDVTGYFEPAISSSKGRFRAVQPTRLADTRGGAVVASSLFVPMPPSVPADAEAVAINVTATQTSGWGYLTVRPAGGASPSSSTLNWDGADQTRASFAIVPVSAGGIVVEIMPGATAHVIVDLAGWFTGSSAPRSSDGLFVDVDPRRVLDSRQPGTPLGDGVPLYSDGAVRMGGVPGSAAVLNVTMVADEPGWLRVEPAAASFAPTSTVNSDGGATPVANLSITALSTYGWEVYSAHTSHVIVDVFGFFTGRSITATQPPPSNTEAAGLHVYPHGHCDDLVPGLPGLNDSTRVPQEYRRIGTSVKRRPIYAERWGPSSADTTVVVIGQVHGDECGGTLLVEELRHRPPTEYTLWIIPTLNPDGYAAFTRSNANDVNLNRDGLTESQPETQALFAFLDTVHADFTVHAHSPYGEAMHYGGPRAQELAWRVAKETGWGFAYAGDLPPDQAYLWQGQEHHGSSGDALLLEFPAMSPDEAPTISRRVDSDFDATRYAAVVIADLLDDEFSGDG